MSVNKPHGWRIIGNYHQVEISRRLDNRAPVISSRSKPLIQSLGSPLPQTGSALTSVCFESPTQWIQSLHSSSALYSLNNSSKKITFLSPHVCDVFSSINYNKCPLHIMQLECSRPPPKHRRHPFHLLSLIQMITRIIVRT